MSDDLSSGPDEKRERSKHRLRHVEALRADGDQFVEVFERWGVTSPKLKLRIRKLMKRSAEAGVIDTINARAGDLATPKQQRTMALRLAKVRHELDTTPAESRRLKTKISELKDALEEVESSLAAEAERRESLRKWANAETRGGGDPKRRYVLEHLASIFQNLTGEPATATWDRVNEDRQTPFVRFAHDLFVAAGREQWAHGLESAAARALAAQRS